MRKLSDCSILVVDDSEENLDILEDLLGEDYELFVALDGKTALEIARDDKPDLILLDMIMPGMNGFEVCEALKSDLLTKEIPIIFLTVLDDIACKTKCFRLGAVDYIIKPFDALEVRTLVQTHLNLELAKYELSMQNAILEEKVIERTKELSLAQQTTIEAMACLAEYGDPETAGHIKRTKEYVRTLANELRKNPKYNQALDDRIIELMSNSTPLHDIGKIGIRDDILLKEGLLTEEEFDEMKKHTIIGHNALYIASKKLGENSFLRFAMELSKYHQEKWDGTGYPDGLIGELIPLSSRIMALADVYDALISKRPYKPPYTHQKAIEMIVASKGTHFDPEIVDAFLKVEEKFREIALKYSDYIEEILSLDESIDLK